ncbi:MAG: hypothetical protein ABIO70_10925 [Pseudomonadota bacterium]
MPLHERPIAWHFNHSLLDRRVVARSVAERRKLARCVIRIGADHGLVAFRCSGTHLHYLLSCDREGAARFFQRVDESLRRSLGLLVGFSRAYGKPVNDQGYLKTAFGYVVGNTDKHELAYDPLHEASMLPDLLGLRLLGGYAPRLVRELLPHVNRRSLLGYFGLSALEPGDDLRGLGDATAAALGLADLRGSSDEAIRARRALLHLAGGSLPVEELVTLTGVSARTLRRLRAGEPEPDLQRAVGLQVALRRIHAERMAHAGDPLLAGEGTQDYGTGGEPQVDVGGPAS